jgi:hypothetical protein
MGQMAGKVGGDEHSNHPLRSPGRPPVQTAPPNVLDPEVILPAPKDVALPALQFGQRVHPPRQPAFEDLGRRLHDPDPRAVGNMNLHRGGCGARRARIADSEAHDLCETATNGMAAKRAARERRPPSPGASPLRRVNIAQRSARVSQ